jgi:hypothetical protein
MNGVKERGEGNVKQRCRRDDTSNEATITGQSYRYFVYMAQQS